MSLNTLKSGCTLIIPPYARLLFLTSGTIKITKMSPINYEYQAARRSDTFKDMFKMGLLLGGGTLAAVLFFSAYMAWVKEPKIMIALAWSGWIFTMSWAFTEVWRARKKIERLEAILFARLDAPIMARDMPSRELPYTPPARAADDDIIKKVLADLAENGRQYNYYVLQHMSKTYSQSTEVKGKILNMLKYWTRDESRPKELSPVEIEGGTPSPTYTFTL